jgi:hypothetical protein
VRAAANSTAGSLGIGHDPGVERARLAARRAEPPPIPPEEIGVPGRSELGDELPVRLALLLDEETPERAQVGAQGFGQRGLELGIGQEVDITVAGRRGDVAQPLEVGAEPVEEPRGNDALGHAEHRPRAPNGHPVVVQELGIEVVPGARLVGQHGGEQRAEHGDDRIESMTLRVEPHLQLGAVVARAQAGERQGLLDDVVLDRTQHDLEGQQLGDPIGGPRVAPDGHDLDDRHQRLVAVAHPGPIDHHARFGLALVVDQSQARLLDADRDQGQQRTHLQDRREPLDGRGVGQVPDEPGNLVDREPTEHLAGVDRSPHEPRHGRRITLAWSRAAAHPLVLENRSFVMEPPVERVVHRPLDRAVRFALERCPLLEAGDQGGEIAPVLEGEAPQLAQRGEVLSETGGPAWLVGRRPPATLVRRRPPNAVVPAMPLARVRRRRRRPGRR